ncbi:BAG family molecular chaperone regulator 4 [Glycine soja]
MESEMCPGGMFVQRREAAAAADNGSAAGNDNMTTVMVTVAHHSSHHHLYLPTNSTFWDVKRLLVHRTERRLFFGGKEKDNEGHLHAEGVRDMSKLLLLEDASSEERKHEEIRKHNEMLKASEAVAEVSVLEVAVDRGTRVSDKEFLMFTELLMRQLLKLDGIEAEGASCAELCRYTRFSEGKELQPLYYHCKAVSVATQWETFDSGMGSLNAPTSMTSSRNVIQDW